MTRYRRERRESARRCELRKSRAFAAPRESLVVALVVALVLAPLLVAGACAPEVRVAAQDIEVYDLTSPGEGIEAGDEIGIRIPLENTGSATATAVGVLAQLLDRNGLVVEQRSLTIARLRVGDAPVFDFRPFATAAPDLIDGRGQATFRVSVSVGPAPAIALNHAFAVLPRFTPDLGALEMWRERFVPFEDYPLTLCFSVWTGTAGLLAGLELYALDPSHPLGISPVEAEAYAEHQALSLLAQYYDPDPESGFVPCPAYPDSSTGLAALAYMLKVHGAAWGRDVREAIRRAIHLPAWPYSGGDNVYNKVVPFPAMHLLFGEASCHAPSWQLGWQELSGMFLNHLQKGGFESNDRHYTMYHLGNLGMLGFVDTPVVRQKARHLFDLTSLLSAHLYLPGGETGVLNTRLGSESPFFFPGEKRERSMGPALVGLAVGDDFAFADTPQNPHPVTMLTTVVALRQPLAPAIRQLFLAKGDGYEAWWLQRSSKSQSRFPGTTSELGEDGLIAYAWQFDVLPGGAASIGSSYGAWAQSSGNNEGVAVRCPGCEQGFAYAYQWQACVDGDTDDAGEVICSNPVPDASQGGYDVERMQVHRTRISLFDPRARMSRWSGTLPIVRGDERTLAYLTNWDHPLVGGEKIFPTPGGWYVGRLGDVFIAYRPLGDDVQTSSFDGARVDGGTNVDYATLFEIEGRSGGMTVVADASELAGDTLADFAAEMDARFWSFTAAGRNGGPEAQLDYRAADGRLCRMKLEYMGVAGLPGKERRYIDCSAMLGTRYQRQTDPMFFAPLIGGRLMTSPFVSFDTATDVLRVEVPLLPALEYDWGALRAAPQPLPVGCEDRAYLELGEPPEVTLEIQSPAGTPSFDVALSNTGFASATVAVSFEGDDCTGSGAPPDSAWLVAPDDVVLPAAGSAVIAVLGSGQPCESGTFEGELVFSALEGNALDARLPVRLTVSP